MIESIKWCQEAENGLIISAGDDMPIIRDEVKRGESQLWRLSRAGCMAYVVTRLEQIKERIELVLVLGEGRGFFMFAPVFIELARQYSMSFRTHVKRKGLVKMWQKLGLSVQRVTDDETILGANYG